jgi:hypothetical protein
MRAPAVRRKRRQACVGTLIDQLISVNHHSCFSSSSALSEASNFSPVNRCRMSMKSAW